MKRTPLKRTAMRRGPGRTKYARRERDIPRMAWIRTQSCAVISLWYGHPMWMGGVPDLCRGEVEAHHAGEHGLGQKAPDDTCIPMCDHHHNMITGEPGGRGCFGGWPRGAVKRWELAVVAYYQREYDKHVARAASAVW